MSQWLRGAPMAAFVTVVTMISTNARTTDAGIQQWTTGGPEGGNVKQLAVDATDPDTLYLAGYGVWKTTDAGATWVRLTSGLASTGIWAVDVDPSNPSNVLAGSFDAGVFRSSDGGATWAASSNGLPGTIVLCLTRDSTTPATVYAGIRYNGVAKSVNGGASWSAASNGMPGNVSVTALAVDPNAPQNLFAGTDGGVYSSTDGGASWSLLGGGLPAVSISSIAIDPTASAVVYVGTEGQGLYRSSDGGAMWTLVGGGLPSYIEVDSIAIDPSNPAVVYLATETESIYRSTDGGATWSSAHDGIQNISVTSVVLAESNPRALYAGTYGQGVFRSIDGAASWSPVNGALETARVSSLAVDPAGGGRLWAGTLGGVWRTDDDGGEWTSLVAGMPVVEVEMLARDPGDPDSLWVGTWRGVYRTTDGGATWSRRDDEPTLGDFEAVATDPAVADRVYSGSWNGLKVSADGGASWHQPTTGPIDMRVLSFAFDPQHPSTVYAGAWQGIYRSDDRGEHWTSSLTDQTIWDIAIDPSAPSTLYVCTYDGVFKSTNGGGSWHPISNGLTANYCWALAVDPSSPETVYQGSDAGVFRTTNGGAAWTPFTGLEDYGIYDLGFSPNHNTLYAATYGGGVASYTFSAAACSLTCSAIVPKTSTVGSEVYLQADAVTGGCASSATYEWDFGDDSPHPSAQNASHPYASPGAFLWSVTASADGSSCSSSGTIDVHPEATSWFVPGVAHAPGAGETTWRTDLAAVNPGGNPVTVTATFLPYDGGAVLERDVTLQAGHARQWRDVLVSLFEIAGDSSAKGTVQLASPERIFASARTYNQSESGTFGQYLPALPSVSAEARMASTGIDLMRSGQLGVIPQLKKSAAFRTNLGVQNLGDSPVTVEIRLYDANGIQLGTSWTATVSVGHYRQLDDVFAVLGGGSPSIAYAIVKTTSPDGAAWFYASVIDNATGDPTTVPVLLPWGGDREIAGIAHAPGAGSTTWRSDVAAVYLGNDTKSFHPRFTTYGGGETTDGLASIPAGGTVEWRDIAVSLFGHAPGDAVKGTFGVDPVPDLYLTARTYNQAATGSFGQYLPAVTAAQGFGRGVAGTIPQLAKNASFRSNVGVLNLSPFEVVAAIKLYDATGSQVGSTRNQSVKANEYFQVDDVFAALGAGNLDVAYATVEVLTAGGRIWAYGSVVDNATGDPTTIPALVP